MKDNHDKASDKASVKIDPEMTKTREESIVSKDGREWDYVVSTKKSGSEKGKEWRWVEDKGKKGKGKEGGEKVQKGEKGKDAGTDMGKDKSKDTFKWDYVVVRKKPGGQDVRWDYTIEIERNTKNSTKRAEANNTEKEGADKADKVEEADKVEKADKVEETDKADSEEVVWDYSMEINSEEIAKKLGLRL